ncbi:DNA-binding protein WhiA [Gulosibacter macacae]|uniref:Probable cell division protein WhiA n=1 Tax=Gulosibacter macacae TaxID=2488791 RepID=A0A3P3VYU6_9MICO|nr:DNA-binding protein WhiA [Gulosibacter macacae]RRJ87238.1 DNA-binding protein WhiA [Gulosibacter macacae]
MSLTAKVKHEIASVNPGTTQARAAQVSSLLRFSGGLQVISRRYIVEAEVEGEQVALRLARELAALFGVRPRVSRVAGMSEADLFVVRVLEEGETLARQTGLMDARRQIVRGLPNRLTLGKADVLAAVWRGAFLAAGTLTDPGRSASLDVATPNHETAMALVGAAGRLDIEAKAREVRGVHRVVLREPEAIHRMLEAIGATEVLAEWEAIRQRRETRATANRLVNFDDANLRRSAQAAVAACARVERAFEILGEEVPEHLRYAGELRLAHRDASLDELGTQADPPMTKDAVAGRIRRLLALADRAAADQGIPGTEANLPSDHDLD